VSRPSAELWKRFAEGQRAAGEMAGRARRLLQPDRSMGAAIDLRMLAAALMAAPPDPVRLRETDRARAAWDRLRQRLR